MKENLREKEGEKKIKRKKESFWEFLCPCLCSKNSNSEKGSFERESVGRRKFEQENTQNESEVHEQTESNIPVHLKSSQSSTHKPQIVQLQKEQDTDKDKTRYLRDRDEKLIKFNIKRSNSNNLGSFSDNNKLANTKKHEDKQNSHPQITITKQYQQSLQKNNKPQLNQTRFTSQKPLPSLIQRKGQKIIQRLNSYNVIQKDRQQLIGIQKRLQQMQGLDDYEFLANWQQVYQNHYPVNKLQMSKLMVLGNNKNRLLCKVSSVKLFPSASSLQRYKESIRSKKLNQKYGNRDVEFNSQLDRYWDKRYFLFERFDEGIKLDEQSWYSVTPEAVADYMSSKINIKSTILDAFCGAGGDALKLAMVCDRIIANDIDYNKIACLINNAKIYDVNNLTVSCEDFFNLTQKVDAVYLAPPWGGPDYYKIESFHPQQFQPKLSKIISKALTLSQNIFFLLPANTDVESLAAIMAQKLRQQKQFIPETCALKLQKIYFNQRLKFIAGFYGNSQVQNQIKLTDQLKYVYDMLRDSEDGVFKYKRLLRKIREEYGMVNLLNWVFESERCCDLKDKNKFNESQISLIEKFERFLLSKELIDTKTLEKIKLQQEAEYQYELKNRQNKSKKQKNKRIQKQKQKQMRQFSLQGCEGNDKNGDNNNFYKDCHQQSNINNMNDGDLNTNFHTIETMNKLNPNYRNALHNQHTSSIMKSHISSSDNGIEQSQQTYQQRDSLRTVSMASDFHQDQLHNITYDRLTTTQSQVSIKDSIQHLQKYDSLDVSVEESYRYRATKQSSSSEENNNNNNKNVCFFSTSKPPEFVVNNQNDTHDRQSQKMVDMNNNIKHRFSSPVVMENVRMKKVKGIGEIETKWQNGTVQQLHKNNHY